MSNNQIKCKFLEEIVLRDEILNSFHCLKTPHNDLLIIYLNNHNLLQIQKISLDKSHIDELVDISFVSSPLCEIPPKMGKFTVFFDNRGYLILFFTLSSINGNEGIFLAESPSYGKKWTILQHLFSGESPLILDHKPIILLNGINSGRIILPVVNKDVHRSFIIYSQDNLGHFHNSLYIEPDEDEEEYDDDEYFQNTGTINPTIIENSDGNLQGFCHIVNWPGLYSFYSTDLGETWTEPKALLDVDIVSSYPYQICKLQKDNVITPHSLLCGWRWRIIKDNPEQMALVLYYAENESYNFKELEIINTFINPIVQICELLQSSPTEVHLFYCVDKKRIFHLIYSISDLLHLK